MKKTLKLFGLAALAAIAFSCTKNDDLVTPPTTPTDETVPGGEPAAPSVVPATDGGVLTSFGATIDTESAKVSVNLTSGVTTIKKDDEALVFAEDGNSAKYVYDDSLKKFVLKDGETPVTVNTATGVYYPASEYEPGSESVKLLLPAPVLADGNALGEVNPMAGVITGEAGNYSVTLNNLTSVLRVKVTADVNISGVSLDFRGLNYAGAKFTVDPTASTLTFVDGTTSTATIDVSASSAKTADVLFLLPAVELTDGLTVTANLTGNHNGGTDSFSISKANYTPEVNKISTMSFYAGLFSGGTGTKDDPYLIKNARDFKHINTYCAEGYGSKDSTSFHGATYKQTADIDFKGAELSDYMIAYPTAAFTGTYDGNNKTLSNFTITHTPTMGDKDGAALFQYVEGGVLKNISISGATVSGGKFTAGLVGYANGAGLTIQNCSISSSEISGNTDFGAAGLIGGLYGGTVTGCSGTDLNINSTGHSCGGIVSYINGSVTVSECSLNDGTTTVEGAQRFGGIVGQSNNVNVLISNCVNNSDISSDEDYLGGIVGFLRAGTLNACGNTGKISGKAGVGGLVGNVGENGTNTPKAYGVITNKCYNTGSVTGTGNNVGGIAGVVTAGRIEQSRNTGNISSTGSNVGGVVAQLKVGDVNACYSGYNNTIQGAACVGGIVGLMNPINCKSGQNRWLGGTKVLNCQSSSYIISTGTDSDGAAGCIVGWACQVSGHWGIVIANCTNWGAEGRVKSTNTGNENLKLGGIVGQLNGGNWAIVDNCFSYTTLNAIQINGNNLAAGTSANTAPFVNIGPVYGYMTGNYATIRDCFYRSGWNNDNYKGKDARSTKTENIVLIKLSNDNVGKGTATQNFSLYSAAKATYSAGTLTLLQALNRSAHNINDESTFKNYQTNVNSSNIAYQGWAQPTAGGWLVPAALAALGSEFYKN